MLSFEEAREIALKNKRLARDGGDPIAKKHVAEGQNIGFKDIAMSVHQFNAPSHRNATYAAQSPSSLDNHAFAVIGSKAIGSITSSLLDRRLNRLLINFGLNLLLSYSDSDTISY